MTAATLWYMLSFLVHFAALAVALGAGVCDAIVNFVFWRRLKSEPVMAAAIAPLMTTLGTTAAAGAALSLVSGVALLASLQLVHWGALWLNLKLCVFVLLTINGVLFASPHKRQVAALLNEWVRINQGSVTSGAPIEASHRNAELDAQLRRLERHLGAFHITENAGFVVILILAVFKFN